MQLESRFACVLTEATQLDQELRGVLDKETGLVWQRFLDTDTRNWVQAVKYCFNLKVTALNRVNRKGWRLPEIDELSSLILNTVLTQEILLPSGHPFVDAQPARYWSATQQATDSSRAWTGNFFSSGLVNTTSKADPDIFTWCVRGRS